MKKITDPEFDGYHAMSSLEGNMNYWIYFSPDNLSVALVNTINNEVIFLSDRASGEEIYRSPNARKHAQYFRIMRQSLKLPPFKGRTLI